MSPARVAGAGLGCGAGVRGGDAASILTRPERRCRLQKAGRRSIASLNAGLGGWDPPGPPNPSSGSPACSSLALSWGLPPSLPLILALERGSPSSLCIHPGVGRQVGVLQGECSGIAGYLKYGAQDPLPG